MSVEQERSVDSVIECVDLCKSFPTPNGEYEVVKNFNVKAKENEFLVLFGPGQCGKTTIINLIAGFEKASSGKILMRGKSV